MPTRSSIASSRATRRELQASTTALQQLESQVREFWVGKEELPRVAFKKCETEVRRYIDEVKEVARSLAGGQSQGGGGGPRGLVNRKDMKVERMLERIDTEAFRKWRHAVMKYVDNIPSWSRGSHVLEGTRVHAQMEEVVKKINGTEAGTLLHGLHWICEEGQMSESPRSCITS